MKKLTWMLLALAPLVLAQRHGDRDWKVEDTETIRRSVDVSSGSGSKKLLVDNVNGFVHVTGYSGSQVQITAEKHIYAISNEAMAEARRDVKLDISTQGNYARLVVDGPFRNSNGMNYRGDDYYGYRVVFDIDVLVPHEAELTLKTINGGDIQVHKTTGDYEINGLNGGIQMGDVEGSGSVHTLNGPVKVTYSRNPPKPTTFKTLNGSIDVYFQPSLNADLSFDRLNGEVFTDFDVTSRATSVAGSGKDGKFVYRAGRQINGRTGVGGPELKFSTLNGTIRLHTK